MSVLNAKHFHDEKAAYKFVEERIWNGQPVCPHCGGVERISPMKGKSTRIGCYKCYQCRKPFTVKIGTIFEDSHVKLHIWLQAIFLMVSSKKGISSNQLHRTLGVTLKTAWFMTHRIREAMKTSNNTSMGGGGQIVEVDETFFGNMKDEPKRMGGWGHKNPILTLVERGKTARSFHIASTMIADIYPILRRNIDAHSTVFTDEAKRYQGLKNEFHRHDTVTHSSGEYVRDRVYTNTVESYFSVFKRGMRGTYQHCSEKHLHRYLAEFDFRYNNRKALGVDDAARAENVLKNVKGKRLTYRTTNI